MPHFPHDIGQGFDDRTTYYRWPLTYACGIEALRGRPLSDGKAVKKRKKGMYSNKNELLTFTAEHNQHWKPVF